MIIQRRSAALAILSGLLAAMAFATHWTGFLVWFAFIPLFYTLFHLESGWKSYWTASGFFGMSFYIGIVHWLPELHPLTWLAGVTTELSLLIVFGGVFLISAIVTLWTVGFGILLGLLKPQGIYRIIYASLLWMIMEWCQGLGAVSLPWARLAMSQYKNLPLLQIISVTGHIFLDGVIIAFNVAVTLLLLDLLADRQKPLWQQPSFRPLLGVLVLITGIYGYGFIRLQMMAQETGRRIPAAVIQGNITQGEKWSSRDQYLQAVERIQNIYLKLSNEATRSQPKPELIVWPESAIPVFLTEMPQVQLALAALTRSNQISLYTGIFDRNLQTQQIYNAAALIQPDGKLTGMYYKRQLVPFGEFMPFRSWLVAIPFLGPMLEKINPMHTDTGKGENAGTVKTPMGNLGGLICFESVYPPVARDSVLAGAEVLLIVTNDGWYKDAIAVYQHNAHAALRAVETDRDVVRAANTGISSFISHTGEILSKTEPLKRTYLVGSFTPRTTLTLYTRWGEWVVYLAILAMVILPLVARKRREPLFNQ